MSVNVFVTRRIPDAGLDLLRKHCGTVDVFPEDRVMTHAEIMREVPGRDGLLCLLTDTIDRRIIEAGDRLRIIANYAVGYNNIDVAAATAERIIVTNTPGVLTDATADLTWALILGICRRIVESDRFTRAGDFHGWAPMLLRGGDLAGRTIGIVGAGRIGSAVARRAAGFDMTILYTNRSLNKDLEQSLPARRVPLETLLREADVISLHVPLTDETKHLIGREELAGMKKTAYLINTSRGPVVDEAALVQALKDGDIAGAALDVFEEEPAIHPGLLELDNVVLTPHTGSATWGTRDSMAVMAAENLIAGLSSRRPPNIVNPDVLG
ncbi:D-glycerate dehydrogenase [bacterium]|nr:D-glycerate dehydrogenase [bacterium]